MTHVFTNEIEAKLAIASAKVAVLNASVSGQLIDNRTAEALASTAEISARREVATARWEDASNSRNREFHFTDGIAAESVGTAIDTLSRWHRIDTEKEDGGPAKAYKFVICSPGGSVVYGMKLYSALKAVADKRRLVTVASGLCASMATIVHQAGTHRVIEPGCSYLIHDVSGESFGTIGSMQDTMDWMNKLNNQLHSLLASKSNKTVEEISTISKRRDAWFMPEEILAMGLADEISYSFT